MFDRFTDRARKTCSFARSEAERFNHDYIGTEHFLLGLIKEGAGVAANVLDNMDVDLEKTRIELEKFIKPASPADFSKQQLPFTSGAKKVLEFAIDEARTFGHEYVGTEHLILGLLREQEGLAAQVLMNQGLRLDDVRNRIREFLASIPATSHEKGAFRPIGQPTVAGAASVVSTDSHTHQGVSAAAFVSSYNIGHAPAPTMRPRRFWQIHLSTGAR